MTILESKLQGWDRKKVECHQQRYCFRESEEVRVLSGVVYMTKSRGLRTDPKNTGRNMLGREDETLMVNGVESGRQIKGQRHENFCDLMALMR